jgi:UDP-glucose 4-epimerase
MSKTQPNVLVTGGAGFIGSHLVQALLAKGYKVTVFDNLTTGKLENLKLQSQHLTYVPKLTSAKPTLVWV